VRLSDEVAADPVAARAGAPSLLEAFGPARTGRAQSWTVEREGRRPLVAGRRILPLLPTARSGMRTVLELRGGGTGSRRWSLEGRSAQGEVLFTKSGRVAVGATERLELPPEDLLRPSRLAWAALDAGPGVTASAQFDHALSRRPAPMMKSTARHCVAAGLPGEEAPGLVIVNPSEKGTRGEVWARGARGEWGRRRAWLPPGGQGLYVFTEHLHEGPVELVYDGDPVVVALARQGSDRTLILH
jgi:hypothetical protein